MCSLDVQRYLKRCRVARRFNAGRLFPMMCFLVVAGASSGSVQAQDAKRGAYVFQKCLACHSTRATDRPQLAPPLANILGRRAGSWSGFDYSDSIKQAGKAGFVWTKQALYYFLDRPETFMPGTYMAFAGLEEQQRRDVIAYLETLSDKTN